MNVTAHLVTGISAVGDIDHFVAIRPLSETTLFAFGSAAPKSRPNPA